MDARVKDISASSRIICVDLDGTLLATDSLAEGVMQLLKGNPFMLFMIVYWSLIGKARLKAEVATRTSLDVTTLPYRQDVLAALEQAKAKGAKLYLTTGAHRAVAEAVANHLGIFDGVFFTEGSTNLTSHAKRELLVAKFGEKGFDYYGNSRDDIEIFEHASQVTVVAPDREARRWQGRNSSGLIEAETKVTLRSVVKAIRAYQWSKNALIFAPLVLSHQFNTPSILAAVIAFLAFSCAASAGYILNDLMDLTSDRKHATKKARPFARGTLSIATGVKIALVMSAVAVGLAALLPWTFGLSLAVYVAGTTTYSLYLKRKALLDVLTLAGLYTLRVIAGAEATGAGVSFWLLTFSLFFFLSLALLKRYAELCKGARSENLIQGRGYREADIDIISMSGVSSAFISALVLALYIDSPVVRQLYAEPWALWPLCPIVVYLTMRLWILARRGEMNEDPVLFMFHDWRSQVVILGGAFLVLVATFW